MKSLGGHWEVVSPTLLLKPAGGFSTDVSNRSQFAAVQEEYGPYEISSSCCCSG